MDINSLQGTVIGDNKYIIIPMENKEAIEFDSETYYEYYKVFKNIIKLEDSINLFQSTADINEEKLAKVIANIVSVNEDNMETIFDFLIHILYSELRNQKIKYNDLLIKEENKFYNNNDIEKVKHIESTKSNTNELTEDDLSKIFEDRYHSDGEPKIMFNEPEEL